MGAVMHRGNLSGSQLAKAIDERRLTQDLFGEMSGRGKKSIQAWVRRHREKVPIWFDKWFHLYDLMVEFRGVLPDDDEKIFEYLVSDGDASVAKIARSLEIPAQIVYDRLMVMTDAGKIE